MYHTEKISDSLASKEKKKPKIKLTELFEGKLPKNNVKKKKINNKKKK